MAQKAFIEVSMYCPRSTVFELVYLLLILDVDVPKPDDKSIMTYVASYYHCFAKMKEESVGGKRIARVSS